MEFVSVEQAREYIKANYPNDPLLKHIVLKLLDQLPKVEIEVSEAKRTLRHG